jgi:CHAT domain-containing protein/tetratricopeptide (TPR) repeat protein
VIALLLVAVVPLAFGHDKRATDSQSPQPGRQAVELFQSALLLVDTKERELARRRMREAMSLWIKSHENEKAARAALQMGDGYKHARNYLESLYCYKQSLDVKLLSGAVKASAYNAIAQLYAELNERNLAKDYFTKAIAASRRIKDVSTEAHALSGLADLHHRQGEREQALACIAQARQLNRLMKDEVAEAALLLMTGQITQEEGRPEPARKAFAEALTIYRRTGSVEGQVKVLCSMTNLSLLASETQAALDQSKQATELAEQAHRAPANADKTRTRDLLWRAWFSRARAERAAGQKELSATCFLNALKDAAGTWWADKISTEANAIAFRQETQTLYRDFVDLLVEQGEVDRAYWWADRAKAGTIRGLAEARLSVPSIGRGAQAGTLGELYRSIARLRILLLSSHTRIEREKLQEEIRNLEYALDEARVRAEIEDSRERLVWSEPATVKRLQERMSRDKSALLQFLLGETRSFAWLITPDGFSCEILPSRKEIEKDLRPYLKSLTTAPNYRYIERDLAKAREQGAALFSRLFGNLVPHVAPGQKLVVVPDGLLHYLPFETLIHDGRYLIQDHEISYNSSASMLGLWQDSSPQSNGSKKMELLAFGDPLLDPPSNASNGKKSSRDVSGTAQSMHAARGYALTSLPRTRDEVQGIAGLFPPERRRVYLGAESTEDAAKRESLRDYRRLHFATHSLIDEEFPSRSALLLTLSDDPREDGFLEAGEISELDIDCDLVVLSACQTGRGKLFSGEGIVGLSRAFLRAGARSVVVSLWNVSDNTTSRLMKDFYQQLVGDLGNAAALREAKLQMIKGSRDIQHPYYWASFVIIGKP